MADRTYLECALLALAALCVGQSSTADAHGAAFVREQRDAVVLRFGYSTGEPMSDTDALVFAPNGARLPLRTDAQGRIVFVADQPGQWHADVDDGLGHELRATVSVDAAGQSVVRDEAVATELPRWLLVLLAVSLLGNLTQFVWQRRAAGSPADQSHG